jgi:hypothetical protein
VKNHYFLILCAFLACSCEPPTAKVDNALLLYPYPNPTSERIDIYIDNDDLRGYIIEVLDPSAKVFAGDTVVAGEKQNFLRVGLKDRAKGKYSLILSKNGSVFTKTFMKI